MTGFQLESPADGEANESPRPSEGEQEADSFIDMLKRFRAGLRAGGPDVDYPVLLAYVDKDPRLGSAVRTSVEKHIVTWQNWFHAYWEAVGDLARKDLDASERE